MMAKKDIYQQITNDIIASLEGAENKWELPWHRMNTMPRSGATGKYYKGINSIILSIAAKEKGYSNPYWFTYPAAKALGCPVRSNDGQKATQVIKYIEINYIDDENDEDKSFLKPITHSLFNAEQLESIPEGFDVAQDFNKVCIDHDTIPVAEEIIKASKAFVVYNEQKAAYSPSLDKVYMPNMRQFNHATGYYATFFHELVHWTGHKSRLDRHGKESYAFEELIAELGSAYLCGITGISSAYSQQNNVSYIKAWLRELRNDKTFIIKASKASTKAVDMLTSHILEKESEQIAAN